MQKGQTVNDFDSIPRKDPPRIYSAEELMEQKVAIVKAIISEVTQYVRAFPPYMPSNLLVCRYSKICLRHGGVYSVLAELEAMGTLRIHLNEMNQKLIYLEEGDDDGK